MPVSKSGLTVMYLNCGYVTLLSRHRNILEIGKSIYYDNQKFYYVKNVFIK